MLMINFCARQTWFRKVMLRCRATERVCFKRANLKFKHIFIFRKYVFFYYKIMKFLAFCLALSFNVKKEHENCGLQRKKQL